MSSIPLPESIEYPRIFPFDTVNGQILNSQLPAWHPDLLEQTRTVNDSGDVIQRTANWLCRDGRTRRYTWNIAIDGAVTTYTPPVVEVIS